MNLLCYHVLGNETTVTAVKAMRKHFLTGNNGIAFLIKYCPMPQFQRVRAIFPDAGAAALLKYQWKDASFGFSRYLFFLI